MGLSPTVRTQAIHDVTVWVQDAHRRDRAPSELVLLPGLSKPVLEGADRGFIVGLVTKPDRHHGAKVSCNQWGGSC